MQEIKDHPWFEGIDWNKLLKKEISPPYVPKTNGDSDTGNVDDEFLNEAPEETPAEMNALMQLHNTDSLFDNFSFVNESNIKSERSTTNQMVEN